MNGRADCFKSNPFPFYRSEVQVGWLFITCFVSVDPESRPWSKLSFQHVVDGACWPFDSLHWSFGGPL